MATRRHRSPLRQRGGVLYMDPAQQAWKLTADGQWALWALLAGIASGLLIGKLLG